MLFQGELVATLPFGAFESGEEITVSNGVMRDTISSYALRMYRIGCSPPPPIPGNLLRNSDFEELTTTGAVAGWGLFWQFEMRDERPRLVSDTAHAMHGRHSLRLQLPGSRPGRLWAASGTPNAGGPLAVPLSLGPGSGCGEGWQGFRIQGGHTYNISVWARSDFKMNLSLASGCWRGSLASKLWEVGDFCPRLLTRFDGREEGGGGMRYQCGAI